MKRALRLSLSLTAFFILEQGYCQMEGKKFIQMPATAVQEDLRTLRDSLIALHPGMYRYTNIETLNQIFDSIITAQTRPVNILDCYATVRYMLSSLKDGHTKASLPEPVRSYVKSETKMFPAILHFTMNKAYLPCEVAGLPAGAEIISIDDTPINHIREKLFLYIRSDGNILTKKYWDVNFGDSPFPFLYYLVYGDKQSFKITYRLPAKKHQQEKTIFAQLNKALCAPPALRDSPTISTTFVNKTLAVLKIGAFVNQYKDDNFEEKIKLFFSEVAQRKTEEIILDLRDNGGGQDIFGSLLYAYLTTSPFRYYRSLNSTMKSLTAKDHPNLAIQQPKQNAFTGKLYILINGQSFSTTAEFCAVAKSNNRATFIGVETGGGYYGNTSGPQKEFALPHSRIMIKIPLHQYVMDVRPELYPDRGILPDYEVHQDINDYILGVDTQYDFAWKLAQSQ